MSNQQDQIIAITVAGGVGRRMASETPKQFLPLDGKPLLLHSLEVFDRHPAITAQCVVLDPAYHAMVRSEAPWTSLSKPLILAEPGAERADSVRSALRAVKGQAAIVLIHDAARPLLIAAMIDATLAHARQGRGAIIARPVAETVKRADGEQRIAETVDRRDLWIAETPQTFPFDLIWRAHESAVAQGLVLTDDAQAVEALGEPVALCPAESPNPKITVAQDLGVVETLLRGRGEGAVAR
ncbi:2-C-methyl-D-erythritol 4-phosphate cytidylyltransferase [Candidatus Sumerlaeota bacterium]|nr:2-C-methyl-D-erythritol 4-phosphate cytidylyltransferase [Candidatus Sumerlaeota bacterium]